MAANKVRLSIGGAEYTVIAEDDVRYVQSLGKELDRALAAIMKANDRLSVTQAAILLALDYADECKKATETADRLREQIKDYLDDASNAKSKADLARHESETLRKEIETLKTQNVKMKAELDALKKPRKLEK
ncbi:MAG: cell division protein ZapA [Clostridia bacterium]|nr:cell division protein ZapA [Clostridia bacterium]MBR2079989.1 cell division protein ZapA [Clostridia bacterium]MBR2417546.1 cell division protein ZapA [Clostridia bacterium]